MRTDERLSLSTFGAIGDEPKGLCPLQHVRVVGLLADNLGGNAVLPSHMDNMGWKDCCFSGKEAG